jgi:hypothetical protein
MTACEKNNKTNISSEKLSLPDTCQWDNPLTDLPWLKQMVANNEDSSYVGHARIYQCSYKDGTGFLIEPCVGCPDAGYSFRSCDGTVLCGGGGLADGDNCSDFGIDYTARMLIWENNINSKNSK